MTREQNKFLESKTENQKSYVLQMFAVMQANRSQDQFE